MTNEENTVQLPETKPYRVCIAGAMYHQHREDTGLDGEPIVVVTTELATFKQEIQLTDREAIRLTKLNAVLPADAPLTYDEMAEDQLKDLIRERGIGHLVRSTSADPDQPLRTDLVNALVIYDQGRGGAVNQVLPVTSADSLETRNAASGGGNATDPPTIDVTAASDEDLDQWLRDSKPTVEDVVAAAGGNPELGARLLAAENRVSGDKPRKTLVDALAPAE
jgi:hypothetical protein